MWIKIVGQNYFFVLWMLFICAFAPALPFTVFCCLYPGRCSCTLAPRRKHISLVFAVWFSFCTVPENNCRLTHFGMNKKTATITTPKQKQQKKLSWKFHFLFRCVCVCVRTNCAHLACRYFNDEIWQEIVLLWSDEQLNHCIFCDKSISLRPFFFRSIFRPGSVDNVVPGHCCQLFVVHDSLQEKEKQNQTEIFSDSFHQITKLNKMANAHRSIDR